MATKTWKIGEYCKGGIITVKTTSIKITIIGKDWDFSAGSRRGSDQSGAKEWTRKEVGITEDNAYRTLIEFLNDLTTHYYAEQVMDWIKEKTNLNTFAGGIYW